MADIVAGFVVGAATEVVKCVGAPIKRQFNYLCCFTTNINGLEAEAEKLDNATRGLQGRVDTERNNLQVILPQVEDWLTKSDRIKDQKNAILNKKPNVQSGCLKLGARFSLSKTAKKTTDAMKELRDECCKFNVISQPGPPAATQEIPLGKLAYEFESRKQIEEDIITILRMKDVKMMIGICGMGGLGKTTMAKRIKNKVREEHIFQEAVMAVVSQQVDKSKIQLEIAGQLGLNLKEETSEEGRRKKLHARLTNDTKRILLVLDDVWQRLVLEDLGIPCDSEGCTILLTSRNRDALHVMNVQKIFGMKVLSEEEAWFLFREGAGTCVDDTKLVSLAKQVVQECRGLPIALTTVGAALKDDSDVSIWKDALRQLRQSDPDIPQLIAEVYNPLKLSYDVLEPEQAKSLFFLCCLFPEDADIPLEYLTYFCMGLRIFGDIGNLEGARNRMSTLIKILKSRSLLLDSWRGDAVRMHDVVRDVCIFIAKQEGYIGGNDCKWISSSLELVGERSKLPTGSGFPNLRLLFFRRSYYYSEEEELIKLDSAFVEGIRDLSVLCIQYYHSLISLPHKTQSLTNLNTLVLEFCTGLKTISVVGELVNLEILICRYCESIEELPQEIMGLNRLKLLELTGCSELQRIGRGIMSSLVGLEELKMTDSFKKWKAEDSELKQNARLRELEALTNLRCLEIDIEDHALAAEKMHLSSKIERFHIRISTELRVLPQGFDKRLELRLEGETSLGDWIEKKLLRDTECLSLTGNGANNVDLAKSQNIRWLELKNSETLQEIYDATTSFPQPLQNLKKLELRNLAAIEQLWKSNCAPLFTNLSSIEIRGCPGLRNLGQLSIAAGKDCLLQLEKLHIEDCEMMEQVFLWNKEDDDNTNNSESPNPHSTTKVFPKLKELKLWNLPNLATFYLGIGGIEFTNLSSIEIGGCPGLRNLGQLSIAAGKDCLLQLEKLHIWTCEMMEQVFLWNKEDDDNTNNSESPNPHSTTKVFPKLKELNLWNLPNLATFYLGIGGIEFTNLSSIEIGGCPGLRNLGQLSIAAGKDCLPQLEKLHIWTCEMMEQVFLWNKEDDENTNNSESPNPHSITKVFPKLKELNLWNLPNLATFYQGIGGIEFPLLTTLSIKECPKMKFIGNNENSGGSSSANIDDDDDDYSHLFCQPKKVSFPNLKKLLMDRYPFCGHNIPLSLFDGLEELSFFTLYGSMSLFSSSIAEKLVSLRILNIKKCNEMLKVIEDKEEEEKVVSGTSERALLFPKLEKLELEDLSKLVTFCGWKCDVELPSLRKVVIKRCPDMENFSLGILSAPNLEAFTTDVENNLAIVVKVSFDSLKKLEIIENENPFYGHKLFISLFNGLKELEVFMYEGSMSLFTSSITRNLVSLQVLIINYCFEIVKVIEDEEEEEKVASGGERTTLLFPKLEKLELECLSKLVTFCEWKCDVELPSLREVMIERCPNMKKFTMGSIAATPNLDNVKIDRKDIGGTKDLNGALQQVHLAREKEKQEEKKKKKKEGDEEEQERKGEIEEEQIDSSSAI